MKLLRFTGENVRGYKKIDVSFREELTFLIGINGSGKTTVLKLIAGLVTPSLQELLQIEYTTISLSIMLPSKTIVEIKCVKDKDGFDLYYTDRKRDSRFNDRFDLLGFDIYARRMTYRYNPEIMREYTRRFESMPVVQRIMELNTPLFLGLNRRINIVFDQNRSMHRHIMEEGESRGDTVDVALKDIQEMVYENIRQNARRQSQLSDNFRAKVLQESFRIYNSNNTSIDNITLKQQLSELTRKKKELTDSITTLGISEVTDQVDTLFDELSQTVNILLTTASTYKNGVSDEYYEALMKWIVNSAQLEKIDSITRYGNQYVESITKLKEPILRFTQSANLFFQESNKEILVDGQGEIKIKINQFDKVTINTIYELSSGEKQLIIMLAHLIFYKNNKYAPVFIIDEPELSLHISWQELFVDALLKASPDTQFILATHAPAIIAKTERKNYCEDLSDK